MRALAFLWDTAAKQHSPTTATTSNTARAEAKWSEWRGGARYVADMLEQAAAMGNDLREAKSGSSSAHGIMGNAA